MSVLNEDKQKRTQLNDYSKCCTGFSTLIYLQIVTTLTKRNSVLKDKAVRYVFKSAFSGFY